jgi:hypothetical protein
MAVAFLALVVATGGTSYAVVRLPARSVATKHLRNGAVTSPKIKDRAVVAAKVAADALTGANIAEATLTEVPAARLAAQATESGHAGSSGGLDRVFYRTAAGSVPPAPSDTAAAHATATATCDPGQFVVGGGVKVEDGDTTSVVQGFPDAGGRSWTASVDNSDIAAAHPFTVYAVCATATAAG